MQKISVITPTNNPRYLPDLYQSLLSQTNQQWEWVLVANGEATEASVRSSLPADDGRIKVVEVPFTGNIGALKRHACENASGDALLEVDHDDLLLPTAIERVKRAFEDDPTVGMVYSNRAAVREDGSPYYFGANYGWEYREVKGGPNGTLTETVMPGVHPIHFSRIWYAPDHLRAWRATAYWEVGGHDATLPLADDHDLCCRFYISSKVIHIDECLYIYRIHDANNWPKSASDIQVAQWKNYERYIVPLFGRWAAERQLDMVTAAADSDHLGRVLDNHVGLLTLSRLASTTNPAHTMQEAWRVLVHGGLLMIEVPSTDGRGAFQDFSHKSYWNQNSFMYWTNDEQRSFMAPDVPRFQPLRVRTYYPSAWHQERDISIVQAHLVALKAPDRFHGALEY